MLAFVAGKLLRVLLRFAITRLAVVIVLGIDEGIQDLHGRELILPDAAEQNFFRGSFSVEVPDTTLADERYGQRPILSANIKCGGPVRFLCQAMHLLVLGDELIPALLVLHVIAGGDDWSPRRSQNFEHG